MGARSVPFGVFRASSGLVISGNVQRILYKLSHRWLVSDFVSANIDGYTDTRARPKSYFSQMVKFLRWITYNVTRAI